MVRLNLELGLFLDPGLVGIWAYDNDFAVDRLGPRVGLAPSKTFISATATGILVTSGGSVAVSLQRLLGYTWMGLAAGGVKLLAIMLLELNVIMNVC